MLMMPPTPVTVTRMIRSWELHESAFEWIGNWKFFEIKLEIALFLLKVTTVVDTTAGVGLRLFCSEASLITCDAFPILPSGPIIACRMPYHPVVFQSISFQNIPDQIFCIIPNSVPCRSRSHFVALPYHSIHFTGHDGNLADTLQKQQVLWDVPPQGPCHRTRCSSIMTKMNHQSQT